MNSHAPGRTKTGLLQRRQCFLCGGTAGWQVFDETWDVVGIGPVRIGIRVCSDCGMVLQYPVVGQSELEQYYSSFSNYTNPRRCGKPSDRKIQGVARQISFVENQGATGGRAFQVGCSNGYTLSAFRDTGGWHVNGIDPSSAAADIARKLYGLTIRTGLFEDVALDSTYDLVIATHILEHLMDPVKSLRKMFGLLRDDGLMLVEVPCLTRPGLWPNGYFSFEHLNYFSEVSLRNCLEAAGFEVVAQEILYDVDQYPIICLGARRAESRPVQWQNDFSGACSVVQEYVEREHREGWGRISEMLTRELAAPGRVVVWGAGIHTSQLFAKTPILDLCHIKGVVDSDPQKWGKTISDIPIFSPADIEPSPDLVVVISTCASEGEVHKATLELRDQGVSVIRLYHIIEDRVHDTT